MATKLLSRIIESSPRTMTAARQERKPPKLPGSWWSWPWRRVFSHPWCFGQPALSES